MKILLLSFFLYLLFVRLVNLDYPLHNGELSRDYLVARHIAFYNEFPLTGPSNQVFTFLRSSPLYYLFLAGFVNLYDDILFLGIINILLQSITIGIVYSIAALSFDRKTGIISAVLFGVSYTNFDQSQAAWQPFLMQPFANTSFLMLLLWYKKKNYLFLILSILTLLIAEAFHHSVLSLMPVFFACIAFILWSKEHRFLRVGGVIATFFSVFLLIYFSSLLYGARNRLDVSNFVGSGYVFHSPSEFAASLWHNGMMLVDAFFFQRWVPILSLNSMLLILSIGCVVFTLIRDDDKTKQKLLLFGIIFIMQPVIVLSLTNAQVFVHYFTAVFGLLTILIALSIRFCFSGGVFRTMAAIGIFLVLVYIFSQHFSTLRFASYPKPNLASVAAMTRNISAEIKAIQEKDGFEDLQFFQVRTYLSGSPYPNHEAFLWAPLEKEFDRPFTRLVDWGNSYQSTSRDEYIFLACIGYPTDYVAERFCRDEYLKLHPQFVIESQIYGDERLSVYKSKKKGGF